MYRHKEVSTEASRQSGLKYALKDRVSIELIGGTSDGRDTFSSVPLGCGERTGEESWSIGGGGAESQRLF